MLNTQYLDNPQFLMNRVRCLNTPFSIDPVNQQMAMPIRFTIKKYEVTIPEKFGDLDSYPKLTDLESTPPPAELIEEELDTQYVHFQAIGMDIPWRPREWTSTSAGTTPLPPYWVQLINQCNEQGLDLNRAEKLIGYLSQECLLDVSRRLALRVTGWEAKAALDHSIPVNSIYIGEKIYLHPETAEKLTIDTDGDTLTAYGTEDPQRSRSGMVVPAKYPFTTNLPALRRIMQLPDPSLKWSNCTWDDVNKQLGEDFKNTQPVYSPTQEYSDFIKTHTQVPIGMLTSAWNTRELRRAFAIQGDLRKKIEPLMTSEQRQTDIETQGLKGKSKDGKDFGAFEVLKDGLKLEEPYNWFLTSRNGLRRPESLDVSDLNLRKVVSNTQSLNGIRVRNSKPLEPSHPVQQVVDTHLLKRLETLGLIKFEELPNECGVPSTIVYLTYRKQAVGLLDVKRDQVTQLGYAFIIPPCYDPLAWVYEDGEVVGERDGSPRTKARVCSGREILAKQLAMCDFSQTIGGEKSAWPLSLDHWSKNPNRVAKLQTKITELCGQYGDCVPTESTSNGLVIHPLIKYTAERTISVDYTWCNGDLGKMWTTIQYAKKHVDFYAGGGKGKNPNIRKYIQKKDDMLSISPRVCHMRRSSNQRAQLMRILNWQTFRVAVVCISDKEPGQFVQSSWITPSGINKQRANGFLPQVMNRPEEGYEPREIINWVGDKRVIWVTSTRDSAEIGKLIDIYGNKTCPADLRESSMPIPQVLTNSKGLDIDLIIPINELVDKKILESVLLNAVEQDILIGTDRRVKALVFEHKMGRTGSANENIPARRRRTRNHGADALCLLKALWNADIPAGLPNVDLKNAVILQQGVRRLNDRLQNLG